jgi:hypothetical protein
VAGSSTKEPLALNVKDVTPPSLAAALTPLCLPGGSVHVAGLGPSATLELVGILLGPGGSALSDVLALFGLASEVVPLRVSDTSGRLVGEELCKRT